MRSLYLVLSALCVFLLTLFIAPQTNAQVCTENSPNISEKQGTISFIRLTNPYDTPLSLYGMHYEDNEGNMIELQGLLLPGEEKIVLLSEDNTTELSEEEQTPQTAPLIVNELFANPIGSETEGEFIELYNPTTYSINLHSWVIADASKEFILDGYTISPNDYLVIPREDSSIALNNTTETITLIDPFGEMVSSISYETTTEGLSWNYGSEWYEAPPTPGFPNREQPSQEEPEDDETEMEEVDEEDEGDNREEESETDEEETLLTDPYLKDIQLSELLPNPIGSDDQEWIELYNPTAEQVLLKGLVIQDKTSEYQFDTEIMPPFSYLLLPRTTSGIALNNTNETISLLVEDTPIETYSYEESEEGMSLGKDSSGDWQLQSPTPGEENTEREITEEPQDDSSIASSFLSAEKNDLVRLTGVITAPAGLVKKNSLFLNTVNGVIEIYSSKNLFPEHQAGSLIEVTGKKSETSTGDRLLLQEKNDFRILSVDESLPTMISSIEQLQQVDKGLLISITGTLIEQNQKELVVDFDDEEIFISLEHTPIDTMLPLKEEFIITGVLWEKNAEQIIFPFSEEHFSQVIKEQENDTQGEPVEFTTPTATNYTEPLVIGGSVMGIGSYLLRERIMSFLKGLV